MSRVVSTLFWVLVGSAFVATPWVLTLRLTPEPKQERIKRWLLTWSLKGLLTPIVLWALLNLGLSWMLQPFMPSVQAAQNRGGSWVPQYLEVLGTGVFVASSYWCAVTLGWVLWSGLRTVEEAARKNVRALAITCSLVLGIPAILIGVTGGWPALGTAATLLLAPMVGYGQEILQPRKLPPIYARAIARIKFGKYAEAEWEIIKELENCEDDFEGWMMLADLYANHFNDLGEAQRTILDLCAHPKVTGSQMAVALHRLADWQLKLAQDPLAARRSLELICERLNGTHLARMAQLRINQLPASALELREGHNAHPIPLPALGDEFDKPPANLDKAKAARLANGCVEQLKLNPNNVAARERLARLLAEQLEQAPRGIEQIQLLMEMPERSDAQRAGWLSLIAAWQLKFVQNEDAGRSSLERLIREFPTSVQAVAARRRLELLARQAKQRSA